jgi:hypothetical protein
MDKPIIVCGRQFNPELLLHLQQLTMPEPRPSKNSLAREVCGHLAWFSSDGKPAISSAKVAIRKLHKLGLLHCPPITKSHTAAHRLHRSQQNLPALGKVPARVDQVKGLHLHLIVGQQDAFHEVWNDLIIDQHPCASAPLVGPQLRYLIGSDHGWLGALSFSPAAFVLGARDEWIGWSTRARLSNINRVVNLSRLLIRTEVKCANLATKVLSLALNRLPQDWQERYHLRPVLVETFVDRTQFKGRSLSAANWLRIGVSSGRGRLGPQEPSTSIKDIWVVELQGQARKLLQQEAPLPLTPQPLLQSLARADWCAHELADLDLGDQRLERRACKILHARWAQPQATFYGTFASWSPAKAAYGFIEHRKAPISLPGLLSGHSQATQARMAAEPWVLLPQDTTTLNYTGLSQTTGLGPMGEEKGQGLWLHSLLAVRPDGIPLGVLAAHCWARPHEAPKPNDRKRNAKSIHEKESFRWLEAFKTAAAAARRMPQTQLVVMTDREGDLYELHDAVQIGPDNLHTLIRAQHDRNLQCHQKLWNFMASQPLGQERTLEVPRRLGCSKRTATVQVRWAPITIQCPAVSGKNGRPPLSLWAIWVSEINAPKGVEPIDWMLLTDISIETAEQAWEKVQWYRCRWGIEEWHRALKSGCSVERREFKTAEHLQRVLAFDLIIAWRILACVKLGRILPQLPATVLYSEDELDVLWHAVKKKHSQA